MIGKTIDIHKSQNNDEKMSETYRRAHERKTLMYLQTA